MPINSVANGEITSDTEIKSDYLYINIILYQINGEIIND